MGELVLPNGEPLATDGDGAKDVSPEVLSRSVIDRPEPTPSAIPSITANYLFLAAQTADGFDTWGSTVNTKNRDRQLRQFLMTESVFASALGVVCARNAAFSWKLEGPERTVSRVQDILEYANMGEGWEDFIVKVSIDLYTQDAGAFIEVVRAADSPDSPVIGLNHLDAMRCYHTGVPDAPVIYQDRNAKYHLLKSHQVITLAEMPTPVEGLYGLQYCALTRMLLAAQILRNIAVYKDEKTGGRHNRAIHLVSGFSTKQINDAVAQHRIWSDAAGFQRYAGPLILGSADPNISLDLQTLQLVGLPDGWDEETSFKHYIAQIAMAFLSDYQDFAPLPGGNLGTSAQSQVLHMKSRGKGPALFMGIVSKALNFNVLPKPVSFSFELQDIEAEKTEAEVKKTRAETRQIMVDTGELSPEESRQVAADDGDIPQEFLEEDLTPKVTAEDETRVEADRPRGQSPKTPEEEEELPEGEKGIPELEEDKAARAGPFERERTRAEGRFRRSVFEGLQAIQRNVNRRLRQESRKELGVKALQDIPNDEQFWITQRGEMAKAIGNQPQEMLLQGVSQASQLGLAIDFELVNAQVLDLSSQFTNEWWEGLQRRTRNSMSRAIQAHIQAGDPLPALTKKLEPLFGPVRAEVISSTEVTRLYAEGNKAAYRSAGVEEDEWQTVKDAQVDPDCEALQGTWRIRDGRNEDPPLHPRCRCWLAPVVCTEEKALGEKQAACQAITQRVDTEVPETFLGDIEDTAITRGVSRTRGMAQIKQGAQETAKKLAEKWKAHPEFDKLAKAMRRFGSASTPIREASRAQLRGLIADVVPEAREAAKVLTKHLRTSSVRKESLWRGMNVSNRSLEELKTAWTKGATIDVPITSASFDREVAKFFARGRSNVVKRGTRQVMMRFEDSQGLPIMNFSKHTHELEALLGGQFEVVSATTSGGIFNVVLRQVAKLPLAA